MPQNSLSFPRWGTTQVGCYYLEEEGVLRHECLGVIDALVGFVDQAVLGWIV